MELKPILFDPAKAPTGRLDGDRGDPPGLWPRLDNWPPAGAAESVFSAGAPESTTATDVTIAAPESDEPSGFAIESEDRAAPAPWRSAVERGFLGLLAASLATHVGLVTFFALFNPKVPQAEIETPIEVVMEKPPEPKPGSGPEAAKAGEKQGQGSGAAEKKVAEQQAADQKAAEQKAAAEEKAAEQKAAEQKAAEQKAAAEEKAAEQKAAEQKAAEQKAAAEEKAAEQKAAAQQKNAERKAAQQKAAEQKAAEKAERAERAERKAAAKAASEARASLAAAHDAAKPASRFDAAPGLQAGLQLPFDNGPEIFRAVAVPLPSEGGDELMSYKVIVFGMLERAKHYPEAARERGAGGSAVVSFAIDDNGDLTNVSLLRSSGETDLDIESVALVARAAPFPKPPEGAQRTFAAEITFGLAKRQ